MGWRILVFYPETEAIKSTNIRQPMLKLKTHSGFHDLFLNSTMSTIYMIYSQMSQVTQFLNF